MYVAVVSPYPWDRGATSPLTLSRCHPHLQILSRWVSSLAYMSLSAVIDSHLHLVLFVSGLDLICVRLEFEFMLVFGFTFYISSHDHRHCLLWNHETLLLAPCICTTDYTVPPHAYSNAKCL